MARTLKLLPRHSYAGAWAARCFSLAIAAGFLVALLRVSAYAATTCPSSNPADPHHTTVAGGCNGNGSKLTHGVSNSIVIAAPDNTHPDPFSLTSPTPTSAVCISLTNNSTQDYFVPWGTKDDWTAFQKAVAKSMALTQQNPTNQSIPLANVTMSNNCCVEQTFGKALTENAARISQMNNPNITVDSNGGIQLCGQQISQAVQATPIGTRYLGVKLDAAGNNVDIPNIGAQNDDWDVNAATLLGTGGDYIIRFSCNGGQWILTNASMGSCTPIDGQCASDDYASGAPTTGFSTPPADLNGLCNTGSIFDTTAGLTTNSSGNWSWVCDGTPGKANANCSALKSLVPAQCATADWTCANPNDWSTAPATTGFATPPATLCGPGSTLDAATGVFAGSGYWFWMCDAPGRPSQDCAALYTAPTATCGPASNNPPPAVYGQYNPPSAAAMCSVGTSDPNQGAAGPVEYIGGVEWQWYCFDQTSNTQVWCNTYDPNTPVCGDANQQTYSSAPTTGLCPSGSTAVNFQATTGPDGWYWNCVSPGYNADADFCFAYAASAPPPPPGPQCGASNGGFFSAAPTDNLCSSGSDSSVTGSGPWNWTCSANGSSVGCSASVAGTTNGGGGSSGSSQPNGACGPASGTTISSAPNFNLCSAGTPSAVTGNGPWIWVCHGTSTDSPQCQANPCTACSGTVSATYSGPRTVTGSCSLSGTTTWNETDKLISDPSASATVSWTDAIGAFSLVVSGVSAPSNYCSPCYAVPQSVSNAKTLVNNKSGPCGSGVTPGSTVPSGTVTVQ